MTNWIGRTVSKVTLERLIGRGGMADVYLGTHTTLNRQVAVKILHGHLVNNQTLIQRFRSEAQAIANLRHPNIVQVYDFDVIEDQPYMVMERLEGPSLDNHLEALHTAGLIMPQATTARLVAALANALDYAHAREIVHRDVKPANVVLRSDSGRWVPGTTLPDDAQPVLTDFGIARVANTTLQTTSGTIVGTPAYMSPEQIKGDQIDSRTDVYSLGVMVYEMLAGRLPFEVKSETVAATLVKHIMEPPAPLPEVKPEIQAVVLRALEKDPAARYQKASDLAFDLKQACGLPVSAEERKTRQERPAAQRYHKATAVEQTPQHAAGAQAGGKASSGRSVLLVGLLAALLIVAGLAVALAASGVFDDDEPDTAASSATADSTRYGAVRYGHAEAEADRVMVRVSDIELPPDDMQYEVWLLGNETRLSVGVLDLDADGAGSITYVSPSGNNLLADYGRFEITVEPRPDSNPLPTGDAVYSGAVPPESLAHVRHLMSSFSRAPDAIGLTIGVMRSTTLIRELERDLRTAHAEADAGAIRQIAEGMVNLIEGDSGPNYGDLDGDDAIFDPGDGYGLLPSSQNSGYIQGSIEHARYASGTPDATTHVIEEARKFEIAAQNAGGWAAQLRDAALALAGEDDVTQDQIDAITQLVDLFINGQDVNNNAMVEPLMDEGGAEVMFHYALSMADMFVLQGANRMPAPTDNNPNPNVFPEYEYGEF